MHETSNLHVVETTPLLSPELLRHELPLSDQAAACVFNARQAIKQVFFADDPRLVAVVGPCSIHDVDAARDYAGNLLEAKQRWDDALIVLMRVYFEKPRTSTGWKGLISDPHLDDSNDMNTGLRVGRGLLQELAERGLPAACEMLDPVTPQYLADLVSWGAIGARTTESQTHRMMASGLSMPVGFKNATDGSLGAAINAIKAAAHSHHFLGVNNHGVVSVIRTTGNGHTHIVLRGGADGPNYSASHIEQAVEALTSGNVIPRIMVDCSHGNSSKDPENQPAVCADLAEQIRNGQDAIRGVMIESNLVAGRQAFPQPREDLVYGQSITDGCVDFTTTEAMLDGLAEAVRASRLTAKI
jgi:3-deoxy-7-phosphoheptulonate synthase